MDSVGEIDIYEHEGRKYVSMESLSARKRALLSRVNTLKVPGVAKSYITQLIKIQFSGID